jgi:class 3 adenylate cyclase
MDGQPCLDEPFSILACAANDFGESFLVLDIVEVGTRALQKLAAASSSSPLIQGALSKLGHAKALALLRTGSFAAGYDLLRRLHQRDSNDIEIVSALARTWKDLAFLADTPAAKRRHLQQSHDLYLEAYQSTKRIFPGINAAATALWIGQEELAGRLAAEVVSHCQIELGARPNEYWATATMAEGHLILRRTDQARQLYERARSLIDQSHKWGQLHATLKQARRLCEALGLDFSPFAQIFRFPRVLVFSGHMFDAVDRPTPRFPDSLEPQVRADLRKHLQRLNPGFGLSAAACGADFLFIEEMLKLGADVRVVLPWPKADFIASSVDLKPGAGWVERFNDLLERVTSVTYLSQQTQPKATHLGYRYLNECINGLALMFAKLFDAELLPVSVWDGQPGDGNGGTSHFVSFWQAKGQRVEIVKLPSFGSPESAPPPVLQTEPEECPDESITVAHGKETIKTMLFADVLGYTKIPERELEFFPTRFLASISKLLDHSPQRPILANTWGDAIFLVFDDVIAAGEFSLQLRDLVVQTNWVTAGFSTNLNLRISLHTGPVLLCVDPIVRHMTITGSHVSHAARIEPKVEPGEIWTSESFAAQSAIAALERVPGYELDYLGQVELAKNYGRYSLFRLRPPLKSLAASA